MFEEEGEKKKEELLIVIDQGDQIIAAFDLLIFQLVLVSRCFFLPPCRQLSHKHKKINRKMSNSFIY